MYLIVDLIWMRYSPLLRWCIKITTVSFSRKLCPTFWLRSNSISSSSTGNWAWSSNRSSQATTTFVSDEVLCVLNLDSGRLSSESSLPRRDMARFWNQRETASWFDSNDSKPFYRDRTSSVSKALHCRAGGRGFDSRGWTFTWLGWPRYMEVPYALGDLNIVCSICTFVLNSLTLKYTWIFENRVSKNINSFY